MNDDSWLNFGYDWWKIQMKPLERKMWIETFKTEGRENEGRGWRGKFGLSNCQQYNIQWNNIYLIMVFSGYMRPKYSFNYM